MEDFGMLERLRIQRVQKCHPRFRVSEPKRLKMCCGKLRLGLLHPGAQAGLGRLLGILPVPPQKRECLRVESPRVVRLPFQDRVSLLLDLSVPVQLPV